MHSLDLHPRCTSVADCANRQDCLGGTCQCLINFGYTNFPTCDQKTRLTDVVLIYSVILAAIALSIAYLHVITLWQHLRQGLDEQQPQSRCRLICARMLSYKGLFCGLSLLFLLLPVVNRCLAVSYFLGYLKDTLIVTSPNGLWRSNSAISFVCLEWAYIVMGNLWLSMAVKLRNDRLTRFAASRWRPFISAVLSLLPLLTAVSFLSVTGDYSAQLFNAAANLLPVGLLAISFLVLATSIMIPVIRRRAKQVELRTHSEELSSASSSSAKTEGSGGHSKTRYVTPDENVDPSRLVKFLKKNRKRRFKPHMDKISEAANSAFERSASTSLVSGSVAPDRGHTQSRLAHTTPEIVVKNHEETLQASPPASPPAQVPGLIKTPTPTQTLTLTLTQTTTNAPREQISRLIAVANRISFTALQVAIMSIVSSLMVAVGARGLNQAVEKQDITAAVKLYGIGYSGYLVAQMWGNLLCLLLLSAPAREAVAPITQAACYIMNCVMTVVDCLLLGRLDGMVDLEFPDEQQGAMGNSNTPVTTDAPHIV